jgi:glutaconate CoA-transferase subunit B
MSATDLIAGLLAREFRGAAAGRPPLRLLAATSMASLVAGLAVRQEGTDLAIAGGFVALDANPSPSLSLGESALGTEASARGTLTDTFAALARGWVGVAVTPAQLDAGCRTNLSFVGGTHAKPKVAFPGSRGLPENNTSPSRVWYVVPKHSPRTLVEQVDFVSGPTPPPGAARRLITNLGIFDFTADGWHAVSLHPGVGADEVSEHTGFAIDCSTATATHDLTDEELAALHAVDPDNLRALEAAPDVKEIGRLIAAERQAWENS